MASARCDECGFDAADYTYRDLLGTVRAEPHIWRAMTQGIDATVLSARPAPDSRSVLEHAVASHEVTRAAVDALDRLLGTGDPAIDARSLAATPLDFDTVIDGIEANAAQINSGAGATDAADPTAAALIAESVHHATRHLREAGRVLHALGAGAPHQRGAVVQVSSSQGGVPKAPLRSATVDRHGVVGDRQADRLHHGRPLQAVCLWSEDVINALRAEGHSVFAGAAGENLTVAGIDWSTMRPGVLLAVGSVRLQISAFATPCAKNAQWFRDGKFRRMDHNEHPGWSRAYAWVLEGGTVATGDAVIVEP